ncbi:MAG: hypothetical protein KQJ78_05570 [Deltaproteobacteria bacterium]|nr:hypothetical protein [Deltaproteobacteria bacterium]
MSFSVTKWITLTAACLLLWGLAVGCSEDKSSTEGKVTAEDVQKKAQETMESAGKYLDEQKKQMLQGMEEQYNKLNAEIDQMKSQVKDQAKDQAAQGQQDWEKFKADIQVKQEEVNKRLEELKQSSQEAWEASRENLQKALDELQKAYDNGKAAFENKQS